jgi:diguanylate cyclase (GGDEF)-like protein/PAS domain S-box-containing protein
LHESRFLTALLSSPFSVLVGADGTGAIDAWSCGAAELYGWSAEEAVGQPLSLIVPAERAPELVLRERLLAGEDVPAWETVRQARDGTPVPVRLHVVLVRDEAGRPVGTLSLHLDLRREHDARQALEVSQEEQLTHFQASTVPQARVALDGRVLAVNAALESLLGVPAARLVGGDGLAHIAADLDDVRESLGRLAAGAVSYVQHERSLRRGEGTVLQTVITTTAVHEAGGRVLALSLEDVTALREAQQQLQVELERIDVLVQSTPVALFSYDLDGICTSSRGQALRHLGLDDGELVGASLLELYAGEPEVLHAYRQSLQGEAASLRSELAGRSWETHFRALHGPGGEVVGGIGIALDLTERATAESEVAANEARLRSLLQHATDVALVLDLDGRIVFASAAVGEQLGYTVEDLLRQDAARFNHPEDRPVIAAAWRSVLGKPAATTRFEVRVLHADGSWRWADHVLTNLLDDPAVGGLVVNVRETTERRRVDEELRRLAVRDSLTGLANRTLLLDRVQQSLVAGQRSGAATGVVVLDVVGMTALNELVGQTGGDEVLHALARRLEGAVRPTDTVARIAGAEFAVLLQDVASEEELRARAAVLLEAVHEPIQVGGRPVEVRLRAGTSLSPAADAGALLATAERAAAITGDRARVVLRSPGVAGADEQAVEALRRAVHEGQLVLHYQPLVRLADDVVVAAEALVRWQHPERGLLAPGAFIPLAERTGLVVELGEWVLQEAASQLATWLRAGRQLSVSINLSPRQLVGHAFSDLVRHVLDRTGVPAAQMVLEVTESALMDDPGAPDVLRGLHATGLRLALDDFGTGYSSLTYLKRFPVDAIKIDRSFVAGLGRDSDDEAIVASVVSLARAVGKDVVAEGVETPAQLEALRGLGVDHAQGFLWSPGLPVHELDAWLDQPRLAPPRVVRSLHVARSPVPGGEDEQRILALHAQGASLHTIAAALNAEGRRTSGGPRWTTRTVARVVAALVSRD